MSKELESLLKHDSLSEAEKITGKSYKEDKFTETLGFIDFMKTNSRKKELLSSMDDTCFRETEPEYMRKVTDFGFKLLLTIPFKSSYDIEERFHIMWHYEYSILLCWDTHTWGSDGSWERAGKPVPHPSRNGGHIYYNWSGNTPYSNNGFTSSGGYVHHTKDYKTFTSLFNNDFTPHNLPKYLRDTEPKYSSMGWEDYKVADKEWRSKVESYIVDNKLRTIWSGDHDCREALKFNINRLAENGTFLKKWKEQPFLWLLHYGDTNNKDYDYKAINDSRIKMLPEDVQQMIKGEK